MKQKPPNLARLYARYNRCYFGGRLPPVDIRYADRRELRGNFAVSLNFGSFFVMIRIWQGLVVTPAFLSIVLLHEMCHVKLWVTRPGSRISHGPVFQAEMKRLAARGAFRDLW